MHIVQLPSALQPGQVLKISGRLPDDFDRATINLQSTGETTEEPEEANILLHVDLRANEGEPNVQIVCNNFVADEGWGEEMSKDVNIALGSFELQVAVHGGNYEVFLNGERHFTFDHRASPEEVKYVFVHHDAVVNSITLDGQQL